LYSLENRNEPEIKIFEEAGYFFRWISLDASISTTTDLVLGTTADCVNKVIIS